MSAEDNTSVDAIFITSRDLDYWQFVTGERLKPLPHLEPDPEYQHDSDSFAPREYPTGRPGPKQVSL